MSDGAVNIWSASKILNHFQVNPNAALLSKSDYHKGSVLGLQFHPQQPNLLASGASDGEVLIWDLADLKSPKANKPNPSGTGGKLHAITAVAWNRKIPHILASATESGDLPIWDLRQKKAVTTLKNTSRMAIRANALAWNPDQVSSTVPTLIILINISLTV
jgi:protein transport protein SEC31